MPLTVQFPDTAIHSALTPTGTVRAAGLIVTALFLCHQSPFSSSFAKINSVCESGKRPRWYHEIETVLGRLVPARQPSVCWHIQSENRFSCDDASIPNQTNLVVKAAEALRVRYGVNYGARIQLEKKIPVQAGLGGGSSNAAVTLLALAQLWELTATGKDLLQIGATLGADVPFFLKGGCVLATESYHMAELPTCLVNTSDRSTEPKVSTANAYQALRAPALTTSNPVSIC